MFTLVSMVSRTKLVSQTVYFIYTNRMHSTNIREIFNKAVESVIPQTIIRNNVQLLPENKLSIFRTSYDLTDNIYVVGFGKAVLGMAVELERIMGNHITGGIINIPEGILEQFKNKQEMIPPKTSKLQYTEGAKNNLPDVNAMESSIKIRNLVKSLDKNSLLIVLISGGGSALLPLPVSSITLEDKLTTIQSLVKQGADIMELNCIRKQLSELKGGGLAKLAHPAKVVSLILSDVINDPLDFIASGPTVVNNDKLEDVQAIIEKYHLKDCLPTNVKNILYNETYEVSSEEVFPYVDNFIIGNNIMALQKANEVAKNMNYSSCILSSSVNGLLGDIAETYEHLIRNVICEIKQKSSANISYDSIKTRLNIPDTSIDSIHETVYDFIKENKNGVCLISGGEPTVLIKGNGIGGRNQELVLQIMRKIDVDDNYLVTFLSAGTDGIDGPTDSAGAITFSGLYKIASQNGLVPDEYLENNDSNSFFKTFSDGEFLVNTGHTGTNVMDIHIIIITKK